MLKLSAFFSCLIKGIDELLLAAHAAPVALLVVTEAGITDGGLAIQMLRPLLQMHVKKAPVVVIIHVLLRY